LARQFVSLHGLFTSIYNPGVWQTAGKHLRETLKNWMLNDVDELYGENKILVNLCLKLVGFMQSIFTQPGRKTVQVGRQGLVLGREKVVRGPSPL
jgi:hypothetical protein